MKVYGSLVNRIQETARGNAPTVGVGATRFSYSDRHAFTVVKIDPKGKKLWATRDKATRTDSNGMSDSQDYSYDTIPDATLEMFTMRKDGRWHEGTTLRGAVLNVGKRDEYYDFSF